MICIALIDYIRLIRCSLIDSIYPDKGLIKYSKMSNYATPVQSQYVFLLHLTFLGWSKICAEKSGSQEVNNLIAPCPV